MDIEKKLESMNLPDPDIKTNEPVKIMLLQAKKSAAVGVWLVAVPLFFLFCITMKYFFMIHLHFADVFEEVVSSLDKSVGTKWISPLLFVGFPLIGILLNLLAIMHFEFNKIKKYLVVTIKIKWFNIFILLLSGGVVCIFFLYVITENFK